MDTIKRISTLCDADKRFRSPLLSEAAKWVIIGDLEFEHMRQESVKTIVIVSDMVTPALEQAAKSLTELWDKIKEAFQLPIESHGKSFVADYRRAWRKNCNNYREVNHIPVIHRARCRWRQRESRRRFEGLSLAAVFVDEEEVS